MRTYVPLVVADTAQDGPTFDEPDEPLESSSRLCVGTFSGRSEAVSVMLDPLSTVMLP